MAVPFVNLITYTWFTLGVIFFTDLLFKTEILFFLTLIGTGLFVSFSVVAYCVYGPMIEDCFQEQDMAMIEKEKETKEEYEKKYLDLIENYDVTMECNDDELQEISEKKMRVTDTTPMGDVLMCYDHSNNRFDYYARTSSIPYRFLDTVCRKFVIEYRCTRLYCNIETDVQNIKEEKEEELRVIKEKTENEVENEGENETETKKTESVFASFKSYNTKKNSGGVSVNANTTINKQPTLDENDVILKDRINSYRFAGKIHEFVDLEEEPKSTERKIDFATFKQMTENKKSL